MSVTVVLRSACCNSYAICPSEYRGASSSPFPSAPRAAPSRTPNATLVLLPINLTDGVQVTTIWRRKTGLNTSDGAPLCDAGTPASRLNDCRQMRVSVAPGSRSTWTKCANIRPRDWLSFQEYGVTTRRSGKLPALQFRTMAGCR